jgi:hypothetical protein
MQKTIRSRSNKTVDDTIDGDWRIVAKRVIAEPTPRTAYDAPRMGIYDYDVVPIGKADPPQRATEARGKQQPVISFRRMS